MIQEKMHARSSALSVKNVGLVVMALFIMFGYYSYSSLKASTKSCHSKLIAIGDKAAELDSELKIGSEKKTQCIRELNSLKVEHFKVKKNLNTMKEKVQQDQEQMDAKLNEMKKESETVKTQLKELQADYKLVQDKGQSSVQDQKKELNDKTEEFNKLKVEMENQATRLQDEIANLKRENARLKEDAKNVKPRIQLNPEQTGKEDSKKKDKPDDTVKQVVPPRPIDQRKTNDTGESEAMSNPSSTDPDEGEDGRRDESRQGGGDSPLALGPGEAKVPERESKIENPEVKKAGAVQPQVPEVNDRKVQVNPPDPNQAAKLQERNQLEGMQPQPLLEKKADAAEVVERPKRRRKRRKSLLGKPKHADKENVAPGAGEGPLVGEGVKAEKNEQQLGLPLPRAAVQKGSDADQQLQNPVNPLQKEDSGARVMA